jgi:hypothetical protein
VFFYRLHGRGDYSPIKNARGQTPRTSTEFPMIYFL